MCLKRGDWLSEGREWAIKLAHEVVRCESYNTRRSTDGSVGIREEFDTVVHESK